MRTCKQFILGGVILSLIFGGVFFVGGSEALAQVDTLGTGDIENTIALGGGDIRVTIMKIIRATLGLLGIVAVGLMVYAGFTWMTSGGQEEKIGTAKKIMINAAIGLAIILSSFAIVQFVINGLLDATGGIPGANGNNAAVCNDPNGCVLPGPGNDCAQQGFVVTSISPNTDATGMSNAVVRVLFSKKLHASVKAKEAVSVTPQGGESLNIKSGIKIADGYGLELVVESSTPACDANAQADSCLPKAKYVIEVSEDVRSVGNQKLETKLACGVFERSVITTVNVDAIDEVNPSIQGGRNGIDVEAPEGVQVARGAQNGFIVEKNQEYTVTATLQDRVAAQGGISYGDMEMKRVLPRVGRAVTYFDGPLVENGTDEKFVFNIPMPIGEAVEHWSVFELKITAHDIDGNTTFVTTSLTVVGEGCLANPGAAECQPPPECQDDRQCGVGGRCVENQCVAWPVITDVSPMDGGESTWVTISGQAFGDDAGTVEFGRDDNNNGELEVGEWRPAALANCGPQDVWQDSHIIVEVPGAALPLGPTNTIRVVTNQAQPDDPLASDTSSDDFGPKPGNNDGYFEKNNTKRAGLCRVTAVASGINAGPPAEAVLAFGKNFGAQGVDDILSFGGIKTPVSNWVDTRIDAVVPAGAASGTVGVFAVSEGLPSNAVPFTIFGNEAKVGPIIDAISPPKATQKSYVTIIGQRFGREVGEVWLAENQAAVRTCVNPVGRDASCQAMNVDLPRACGKTWNNTQIIVTVPDVIPPGDYALLLRSQAGTTDGSNTFSVLEGPPTPGICALNPTAGPAQLPAGKTLSIIGTNFIPGPTVYFWKDGAVTTTPGPTWFSLGLNDDPNVLVKVQGAEKTKIKTDFPIDANGATMPPGLRPIAVRVNDKTSNYIYYNVADCREEPDSSPGDNFRCCTEGPEAGFWKEGAHACFGEVREAGYVWRFTSGRVPSLPRVLEQCRGPVEGEEALQPSPTPALRWRNGQNACVNSLVNLQFSHAMKAASFADRVHVYQCIPEIDGEGVRTGEYDCNVNARIDVTDQYEIAMQGNDGLRVDFAAPRVTHDANTYYRVVLDTGITGETVIEGLNVPEEVPLLVTRPAPGENDTAYHFDFLTGDGVCRLDSVGVRPARYTVTSLGTLLDPRYGLNPEFVQNFVLYGRGNQECSLVDAGEGWDWTASRNIVNILDNAETTQKVTVEAVNDAGDENNTVMLRATSNTIRLTGESELTFDLGDPKVTSFWPKCAEACPNASFGVRFSRDMFVQDLNVDGSLQIEKCTDGEICAQRQPVLLMDVELSNPRVFEKQLPQNLYLDPASWYIATLSSDLRAVAQIDADGNQVLPGRALAPIHEDIDPENEAAYQWKFRTKEDDELCLLDRTEIEPAPYIAREVGDQTNFAVVPYSSPDACSDAGQRLNPWGYGWSWESSAEPVATVSDFQTTILRAPFCDSGCTPRGSMASINNLQYLCGNGDVDPGEDCDIGVRDENGELVETIGVSCTLSCLRPGNLTGLTPDEQPGEDICGNAIVESNVGEECDDKNNIDGDGCSSICQFEGASQEKSVNPLVPWCGGGTVTAGEECDISLSVDNARDQGFPLAYGSAGCSQSCQHEGTALAQAFCDANAAQELQIIGANGAVQDVRLEELPECVQAVTQCGNSIVEQGEECEFGFRADGSIDTDVLIVGGLEYPVEGVTSYCTPTCTLRNICGLPALSEDGHEVRCTEGEGCNDDCTLAGSSVRYNEQSVCGDGQVGVGESLQCEIGNRDALAATLGQNPIQLVTAVGEGVVVEGTTRQHTEIQSTPLVVRNQEGVRVDLDAGLQEDGTATADYYLQCGFAEHAAGNVDVLRSKDGGFERGRFGAVDESNLWNAKILADDTIRIVTTTVRSGNFAAYIETDGQANSGIYQEDISLQAGTYKLSFWYNQDAGQVDVLMPGLLEGKGDQFNGERWMQFTSDVEVPADREDVSIIISKVNGIAYIDDISLVRVNRGVAEQTNNCPGNNTNAKGVGINSCCYPRAEVIETYPVDGSGLAGSGLPGVCRNTYVEVAFDGDIDEDTIAGSVVLVRGVQRAEETCALAGEQDVTEQMRALLAANTVEEGGFWKSLWKGVSSFFVRLFTGEKVTAAAIEPQNVLRWCESANGFTHEAMKEENDDGVVETTRIALFLQQTLNADTVYGVMIRGGSAGLQDTRGVGIRGRAIPGEAIFPLADSMFFQTTDQICRLKDVTVVPRAHVYTAPEEEKEFFADTVADNGQRIVQTPAYNWEWRWIPRDTVLYTVPADDGEMNRTIMPIRSTGLEGTLAMSAQALVTIDRAGDEEDIENSHVGRAFTGYTQLTSQFCENPWPPRSISPYEDGVPFGQEANNDAFVNGEFTGQAMTQIAGEYFNFSMSYCADAGVSAETDDDLPVLEPSISHDGVCQYARNACSTNEDCPYVGVTPRVAYNNGYGEGVCEFRGGTVPAKLNRTQKINLGANRLVHTRINCTEDAACQNPNTYKDSLGNWNVGILLNGGTLIRTVEGAERDGFIAEATCNADFVEDLNIPRDQCIGVEAEVPQTVDRSLKQTLFFNDKNDDVIGMRIFDNVDRLSAADWYAQQQFGFGSIDTITVDGFDGVTDGNSVFINFLNKEENGLFQHYILALTMNEQAQDNTRQVFDQLLTSLTFNINMSDFGLCLAENDAQGRPIDAMPRDAETLGQVSDVFCQDDFDCREDTGAASEGLSGICSTEKTKFRNDWSRLIDMRRAQGNLAAYKERTGNYPDMLGGSFIPTYTNSRWNTSWGALGQDLGGLPLPLNNNWSTCDADEQTCWNADTAQFMCPAYASVYEYKYDVATQDYMLHGQLEYFTPTDSVIRQFVNINHFTTNRWCEGQAVGVGDGQNRCGDGVLNPNTEQCDPPGANRIDPNHAQCGEREVGLVRCTDECQLEFVQCQEASSCGDGFVDVEAGERCDDGVNNDRYGFCSSNCVDRAPIACGNGSLDFVDANNNGVYDQGEVAHELCDEVGGVCQFILPGLDKIEPMLFFLIDHSGSMNTLMDLNDPDGPKRWDIVVEGMELVAAQLEGKAKIGVTVFSGEFAPIRSLLDADYHTAAEVRASLEGLGYPNPRARTPLQDAIPALVDQDAFLSNDPIDSQRPRSLILVVDGDSDRDPTESITSLRENENIYTYVLGVGTNHNNFNLWAERGGTQESFRVNEPGDFSNRVRNMTQCYEQALRVGDTCSLDCQSFGKYCGDGVRQGFEECDDGNTENGDGCNSFCQEENLACKRVAPFENRANPQALVIEIRANGGDGQPFDQCFE